MKSKHRSPIWPYLVVLACLFVLSITAPRAWDRMARRKVVGTRKVALKTRDTRTSALEEREKADPRELEPRKASARSVARQNEPKNEGPSRATEQDTTLGRWPIHSAAPSAPQVVPPAPPYPPKDRSTEASGECKPVAAAPPSPHQDEPQQKSAESTEPTEVLTRAIVRWPEPRLLVEQLTQLRAADPQATWAEQAIALIRQLCESKEGGRPAVEMFVDLRALAKRTDAHTTDRALETQTSRARYSLARWVDVWEPAVSWDMVVASESAKSSTTEISSYLDDVVKLIGRSSLGTDWRGYLMIDALRKAAKPGATDAERRAVARRVLDRMTASHLTRAQRNFIAEAPLVLLQLHLRAWAAEGVASSRLMTDLERYEHSSLPSDARAVADDWRGLKFAAPTQSVKVGSHLETHYRNANVRVAVAAPLLNRMLPQPETIRSSVQDRILDLPVCGRSTTFTKVTVKLVPDPERIRLGLEARGTVASDTVSASGPVKFRNQGQSTFLVRKLIVIGPDGMSTWPAVAQADNNFNNLVAMETNVDGVPLVGALVRSIARSQYDDSQGNARAEVEQKVAIRARDQFDSQVRPQLAKAVERIQTKQVAALKRLGLEFVPLDLSTSADRLVARLRLATNEQLGAHTPRPQAPSDSWLSVQLHQSALNNTLEQLDLAGRKFTLPELFTWVGQKLDRPEWANREDLPEDVRMKFAAKDPVRLRCLEGKFEVTLAFEELSQADKRWRNFSIRTYYRPKPEGRDARLGRDSTIYLDGKSVRGAQPLLRAIFSKVLSKNRDLHLLDAKIINDPRMDGLEITQFVVEDGWVGLAYSPDASAGKVARKPKK